jgi:hypothetical protein
MGNPGQLVVKRYRLVRALGKGAMGVVWEGHDDLLDRPVAVKEILPPAGLWPQQEADFVRRIFGAAGAATRVTDRDLVTTYDVAEEDGRPWIVMELFPSRSLDGVIANDGALTPGRAAEVGRRVLGALSAAHAAGVVHGDVKPANVLIGYTGRIALSDLGAAPAEGTPGFQAPEGAGAGPAADLWSLGATLYSAVTAKPPADEPDLGEVPVALRPVLWGLLTADPAKRLKAAEATKMLADLVPAAAPTPPPKARAGRTRLIAGAAGAVVIVGAIGGWALLRSPDPAPAQARHTPAEAGAPSAAPVATPTPAPARLPLKWYKPGTGWQAAYPKGWTRETRAGREEWTSPDGGAHFGVEVIDWGGEDPLAVLRTAEAQVSSSAKAYRKVRLERIKFTGAQAAEWEGRWKASGQALFPWSVKGVVYHELRRVIFTGKTTTILSWVTADRQWTSLRPTMRAVLTLYRVPVGDLTQPPG